MQSLIGKITGDSLTAAEWNQLPAEVQNVITALGITLSSGSLNQLGQAIAGYVANGTFYTDSGVADAYVLATVGSKQVLPAYTDDAAFVFFPGNTNTGASTANVGGLGVKNIKTRDGRDPAAGMLRAGQRVELRYDAANGWLTLVSAVGVDGTAEILPFTFASDANDTLTDGENTFSRIEISGTTLTAARTLTVAGLPRHLSVKNGEGFAVTVQGGTGISVPAGEELDLFFDGTNVIIPEGYIGDGTSTIPKTTVIAGSAKAWVNFNGTGTVAIRDSFNVTSITDNGTGDYTLNFTSAFTSANYSLILSGSLATGAGDNNTQVGISRAVTPLTTGSASIRSSDGSGTVLTDLDIITGTVYSN